ncbi:MULTISPECIES: DUF1566 domain-containing protein [Methylomonas]|uniref:DUF1566 domain-containing protein n=2 Tax=Methylomonas TaxID=416 RepID=A0A140E5E1_9GAMM|nr:MULTISPECIES: DUF1566 domain-containing protein [Methylomonas]AMK75615.1 hypothetical protein JT25_003790 [Methylomonas denitrificans]OAI08878.1 hypothetical protein A1342_08525 [Methylomonas methanica]TCV73866.1 uncharacterized protein DUF1566 [Methylomonas methanica]
MNTAFIVYTQIGEKPAGDFAAKVATNYRVQEDGVTPCTGIPGEHCYADWYLPSKAELYELFQKQNVVGGFYELTTYWSSTEHSTNYAWVKSFDPVPGVVENPQLKNSTFRVRAIRAF